MRSRTPLHPTRLPAALLALAVLAASCDSGPAAPGPAAFPGSAPSLSGLGRIVLEALVAQDTAALERVRLDEAEHNGVVFPELPAGRPEVGYPVDMAWQNIELRNARDRTRQLRWFRGRNVTLVDVECRDGTRVFESFVVHTGCVVVFDDGVEGRLEVAAFEDVLERDGGFKIFRFYDHAPRRVAAP